MVIRGISKAGCISSGKHARSADTPDSRAVALNRSVRSIGVVSTVIRSMSIWHSPDSSQSKNGQAVMSLIVIRLRRRSTDRSPYCRSICVRAIWMPECRMPCTIRSGENRSHSVTRSCAWVAAGRAVRASAVEARRRRIGEILSSLSVARGLDPGRRPKSSLQRGHPG